MQASNADASTSEAPSGSQLPEYETPPSPPPLEDLLVGETHRYEAIDHELPGWSERLPDVDSE